MNQLYNSSVQSASTSNLQNGIDNSASPHDTAAPQIQNTNAANAKLKCGVWIFFAMITFFLASAKYYFHGINIGMETLAFCALLIIILVIGGLVSLYEAITTSTNNPDAAITIPENTTEGEDIRTNNNVTVQNTSEMPPPPYHIAIRLPLQNEIPPPPHPGSIQIDNRDSPPPPYEKAVT